MKTKSRKPGRKPGRKPTRRESSGASDSYLALASVYPIHPIRSDADLNDALAVVDLLLARTHRLDDQEQDYLDSLSYEIERYEAETYPMPALSEAELLREMMAARDATLSEVADGADIAISTLSSILSGKRKLNLAHVRQLAAYFGVGPGVFLA